MSIVRTLQADGLTLQRIEPGNILFVEQCIRATGDVGLLSHLNKNYMPAPNTGKLTNFGFAIELEGRFVGLTLLCVSSWVNGHGFTTTNIAEPNWGYGVAPRTKPHLFYLGFEIIGLNRIEAGCGVSNRASKRSIEKTRGFVLEGRLREYVRGSDGRFEDEDRYAILRSDWAKMYDASSISVVME